MHEIATYARRIGAQPDLIRTNAIPISPIVCLLALFPSNHKPEQLTLIPEPFRKLMEPQSPIADLYKENSLNESWNIKLDKNVERIKQAVQRIPIVNKNQYDIFFSTKSTIVGSGNPTEFAYCVEPRNNNNNNNNKNNTEV